MSIEEQHVALPKLYGAPAYARPAAPVDPGPKPFDPDELPIEAFRTEEEHELIATLPARAWAPGGALVAGDGSDAQGGSMTSTGTLRPRALHLRKIAGRLLGGD